MAITSEASLRALLAFCSPSAAMTYNNNIAQRTKKNIILKMIYRLFLLSMTETECECEDNVYIMNSKMD